MLWVSFPWIPWIPQVLWVPSLLMKSRKLSHSLLIIIPALGASLAHSLTLPRLLSSSKFLFDPFPYLVLSSPSQMFPNRTSLSPPSSYSSIHTTLVLYPPSTKIMISIIKDFLTNRPADSLIILYLSRPHPPHLPLVSSLL